MEQYNVKCPICGTINKGLYMRETNGWMICEKCQHEVQIFEFVPKIKIPLLTPKELKVMVGN